MKKNAWGQSLKCFCIPFHDKPCQVCHVQTQMPQVQRQVYTPPDFMINAHIDASLLQLKIPWIWLQLTRSEAIFVLPRLVTKPNSVQVNCCRSIPGFSFGGSCQALQNDHQVFARVAYVRWNVSRLAVSAGTLCKWSV